MKTPYEQLEPKEILLRDFLAVDRTVLANERTLLAYLRTALGALIAGISLVQFFDTPPLIVIGWILVGLSVLILGIGVARFLRMKRCIDQVGEDCPRRTG